MSEFMQILKDRRSVRSFLDKEVPEEVLSQVFEAVQWSPSWANTQCWELVTVTDRGVRERLQGIIAPKNPATKAITDAPVLLAVCGALSKSGFYKDQVTTKFGDWFMFDLGIANQSIMLAAHALGLGSVCVGLFDHAKAAEILNVPDGCEVVTLIPMGYPAKVPKAPKRKEVSEFLHHNRM